MNVYLIVQISMNSELGFDLPLEKSIMELLVVDVDLAHLRPNFLSHFGLHSLCILLWNMEAGQVMYKTELPELLDIKNTRFCMSVQKELLNSSLTIF